MSMSEKEKNKLIQDKCQTILSDLLKDEDNKYCVDCDAKSPRWASWNLGIFLCIRCAGIHRNLGVHISRVKSVNLDSWTPQQVASIQQMGNSRARAVYEANIPDNFRRPQSDSALEQFVKAKYEAKKYIAREWVKPPTPNPTWDLELEKQLRKKKRDKQSGTVELPAPVTSRSARGSSASPKPLPKAPGSKGTSPAPSNKNPTPASAPPSSATQDLLGLDTSLNSTSANDASDPFGEFFAAPGNQTINQPSTNQQSTASQPQDSTKTDEENFFNQKLPENQSKMTKDSILALYGQGCYGQGMNHPGLVQGHPPNLASMPPNLAAMPPNLASMPPNLASVPSSIPPNLSSIPPNLASVPSSMPPNLASVPSTMPPNLASVPSSMPPNLTSIPPNLTSIPPNLASVPSTLPPNLASVPSTLPPNLSAGSIPPNLSSIPSSLASIPSTIPVSQMGGPVPAMGGPVPAMGGPVPAMGGPVPAMGGLQNGLMAGQNMAGQNMMFMGQSGPGGMPNPFFPNGAPQTSIQLSAANPFAQMQSQMGNLSMGQQTRPIVPTSQGFPGAPGPMMGGMGVGMTVGGVGGGTQAGMGAPGGFNAPPMAPNNTTLSTRLWQ